MTETAAIAAVITEGKDIYLMIGRGDHSCQRWKLTESLARKLRRELNQRLD